LFLKDVFYESQKGKKGKFFPACAMKAYAGSRGTTPLILNLGTSWRWMVYFMSQQLYLP